MQFEQAPPLQPSWATTIQWNGASILVDRFRFVVNFDLAVIAAGAVRLAAELLLSISSAPLRLLSIDCMGSATFEVLDQFDLPDLLRRVAEWLIPLLPTSAIRYIEPDRVHAAMGAVNDPYFSDWPYAKIRAAVAWGVERGQNSGVMIGVIDSGIALASGVVSHPDFNPARFHLGGNFVHPGAPPADDNRHGTMVTGIIAAENNNGTGIPGMTASTCVHVCKVLRADAYGTESAFKQAVQEIVDPSTHKGRKVVINYSAGGSAASAELESACRLLQNADMLLCAAAGAADGTPVYPAAYSGNIPTIVAVGGVDKRDRLFGPAQADLFAPAVDVRSTVPPTGATYWSSSGTSLATPFVAGLAALIWSAKPSLSAVQVKQRMITTARSAFGRPIIDAGAALAGLSTP